MIKTAGLLLVFAASAIYGFVRAAELSAAKRELGEMISYFRQFRLLLRARRAPTAEIVAILAGRDSFAALPFAAALRVSMELGGSFASNLPDAIGACCPLNRIALTEILSAAGEAIGTAELESQLSALDMALLRLQQTDAALGEICRTRCPMYRRLGVLGGILVTVILA